MPCEKFSTSADLTVMLQGVAEKSELPNIVKCEVIFRANFDLHPSKSQTQVTLLVTISLSAMGGI